MSDRTYTREEVLDLMWWALRPHAFRYSPGDAFYAERAAYHRAEFAKELDRREYERMPRWVGETDEPLSPAMLARAKAWPNEPPTDDAP